MSRLLVSCIAALAFCSAAMAVEEETPLDKRVMALASELRCLVCQNQTLADSNADLALDLRNTIREQLARGASEREVIDFMTARYGDFVLYRPPLKATTVLLWTGPFLLLAFGLWFLLRKIRARPGDVPPLSDQERARAEELLK